MRSPADLKARLLVEFPSWQTNEGAGHLASYVTVHGCSGDSAVAALSAISSEQNSFVKKHGRFAASLSELLADSIPTESAIGPVVAYPL